MTLTSMMLHSLLTRALTPLHLEIRPSRTQIAGRLLAAGAVGAVIGAGAMALLAPTTGANARATLRRGLARVAPAPLAAQLDPPNGTRAAQRPAASSQTST